MVMGELTQETQLLVIGGGPGGYAAAFRAADLGLDVTMIDESPGTGGACLFRGCIPSKTLLFVTELMYDAGRSETMGIAFDRPRLDLGRLRSWKGRIVDRLAIGLVTLANRRGVQLVQATAEFESPEKVRLHGSEIAHFKFRHVIVAAGSRPATLPGAEITEGGRIMDSTGALELPEVPDTMLVIGGGYVGLELGSVYAALGTRVTLVEVGGQLLPGMDQELVRPLRRKLESELEAIHLNTRVRALKELPDRVEVALEGDVERSELGFGRVLVAIGRTPNTEGLKLEKTGARLNERGFIVVDEQQRTSDGRVLAIGDVVGGAMLVHKAMREGRIAAEVIAGQSSALDVRAIPAVVYTDPQMAWCGLTEEQANREGPGGGNRGTGGGGDDRRGGAGRRDGGPRRGHGVDHAPTPDPVGNRGGGGGSLPWQRHPPYANESEVRAKMR